MVNASKPDFEFIYSNNSRASNLIIKTKNDSSIVHHQVEMLVRNNISGIIKLNLLYSDMEMNLYYEITSKLSLKKFLSLKVLKREEILSILSQIIRILTLSSGSYMLYDKYFLIDSDYIFIEPDTLNVWMVYVPVKREAEAVSKFREFALDIVTGPVNLIEQEDDDNYLQRLISFLKDDLYTPTGFVKLLDELLAKKRKEHKLKTVDFKLNKSSAEKAEEETAAASPAVEKGTKEHDAVNITRTGIIAILLTQLFFLGIFIVFTSVVPGGFPKAAAETFGLLLVIGALDFIITRHLAARFKTAGPGGEYPFQKQKNTVQKQQSKEAEVQRKKTDGNITYLSNKTEILDERSLGVPCLVPKNKHSSDEIHIVKSSIVIGRMQDMVDYIINNNSVGKVHAEIIVKDECYYLKDLNSRNGTYINDKKIDSNIDYSINNKDRITFANCEYVFIQSY